MLWLLPAFIIACSSNKPTSLPLPTPALLAILPTTIPNDTATASFTPTAIPTLPPTHTPIPSQTPASTPAPKPTTIANPSCTSDGQWVNGSFDSQINGDDSPYRIYLPPCYGEDGHVYPTIYLLHGNGQSEETWGVFGVDDTATAGILAGTYPPFLIVTPQGGWAMEFTSGGNGSLETVILNELIPHIENSYCAWQNPQGRAIGGISRGGYWALEISFRHPAQFASVGGHSAALLDSAATAEINPQRTGLTNSLGNLRIYLDVGEIDWGSRINLEQLHEDMANAGIYHEWHLNNGGHNADYWSTQMTAYLDWYSRIWVIKRDNLPLCRNDAPRSKPQGSVFFRKFFS